LLEKRVKCSIRPDSYVGIHPANICAHKGRLERARIVGDRVEKLTSAESKAVQSSSAKKSATSRIRQPSARYVVEFRWERTRPIAREKGQSESKLI